MASADVPENANAHCPGTSSEEAGTSSACDGCPNQQICKTAPKDPDPAVNEIGGKLSVVRHKLLVLSGKGGVGKSTFSSQLAFTLASLGKQVGLLDIDLCGPSIPRMTGTEGEEVHQSSAGWSPVYVDDNLGVMSIGFMLPNPDDAVIWRGPRKNALIKQFLKDVYWGEELDYLVIDTPPGTSDEHLSLAQYLKDTYVDGAIIVTTPQEVSLADVRKEINFCKKVGLTIIGVVENMSGFVCPNCKCETQIFQPTSGGAEKMAADFNVPFLGRIPMDPQLVNVTEHGRAYVTSDSAALPGPAAFSALVQRIVQESDKLDASASMQPDVMSVG